MEQPFTHGIDLSGVSHRHGQSPDLEPKRQRAWERMDDREQKYIVRVYNKPVEDWDLPFLEAGGAYQRVLYVLVTTDTALSADQIAYLMIARHYRNADITSVRKQLAIGVRQGNLRLVGHNRYGSTDEADEMMRQIEQRWRAARHANRVARVIKAATLAGISSPDLSTGPPEEPPEDPEEQPEGEAAPGVSSEGSPMASPETSIAERFPGMSGFEGDPDEASTPGIEDTPDEVGASGFEGDPDEAGTSGTEDALDEVGASGLEGNPDATDRPVSE